MPRAEIWPLREPERFAPWKRLGGRLFGMGQRLCSRIARRRRPTSCADSPRFAGISKIDDVLDEARATTMIVEGELQRLGIET